MNGKSPGTSAGASSSTAPQTRPQHNVIDDLDGDEAADLSVENALLADDPLGEDEPRTASVVPCVSVETRLTYDSIGIPSRRSKRLRHH